MTLCTTVCRICLATDLDTVSLTDARVQAVYEKISSSVLHTVDKRPVVACFICYGRLIKCHTLMQTSARAETVLTEIVQKHKKITKKSLDLIDRKASGLCGSLCISKVECIDSAPQCKIKEEIDHEEAKDVLRQEMAGSGDMEDHDDTLLISIFKERNAKLVEETAKSSPPPGNEDGKEDPLKSVAEHIEVKEELSDSFLQEDTAASAVDKLDNESEEDISLLGISKMRPKEGTETPEGGDDQETNSERVHTEDILPARHSDTRAQERHDDVFHRKLRLKAKSHSKPDDAKKTFTCDGCDKQFSCRSLLLTHIQIYTDKELYKCDKCQEEFSYECVLKKHKQTHTEEHSHISKISQRPSENKRQVKRHKKKHSGEKRFQCNICNRTLAREDSLMYHLRKHRGEKPYNCNICERSYVKKPNLVIHLRRHTGEKPFECNICLKAFSSKSNLIHHVKSHTSEKPLACKFCSCRFKYVTSLQRHERTHTGVKPFQCEICQARFAEKRILDTHLLAHSGTKPYQCDICQARFSRKMVLKIHIQKHMDVKLKKYFECHICPSKFIIKDSFTRHLAIHTSEKRHQCVICNKVFYNKSHLTRHLRTHTGDTPFQCNVCQQKFKEKRNLLQHKSRKHII